MTKGSQGDLQAPAPAISIIIVSFNNRALLADCLDSLRGDAGGKPLQIIVIDNGSGDGTVPMLQQCYPEVELLQNSTNLGMTKAINRGLSVARGDYVALLDADTVLAPDVLSRCMDFLAAHPEIGIVSGRLQYPDGRPQTTARNFPRPWNALFGRHSWLSRAFPGNPISERYLRGSDLVREEPYEVDWVSAACMIFRRQTALDLGGLDENFFVYWVDADWCMRVHKLGLKVVCIPSAKVIHAEQFQPWKRKTRARIVSFHQGAYRFYSKHYAASLLHPMRLLALAGLTARCAWMLLVNHTLKR